MEKTSGASDDYPKLASLIILNGYRVQTDTLVCTDTVTRQEKLTWRQRLRSWKPWKKTRTVVERVPSNRVLVLGDTIICQGPEMAAKIMAAVEAQTKRPVPPPLIHKE